MIPIKRIAFACIVASIFTGFHYLVYLDPPHGKIYAVTGILFVILSMVLGTYGSE